jgi:hypothetical protein
MMPWGWFDVYFCFYQLGGAAADGFSASLLA